MLVCVLKHIRNITGGIPAWRDSSAAAKAVRGVSSEGFMTTVQPHARAGPTWNKCGAEQEIFVNDNHALKRSEFFYLTNSTPLKYLKNTLRVSIANGKFQGVTAPTTPTGCKRKFNKRSKNRNRSKSSALPSTPKEGQISFFVFLC